MLRAGTLATLAFVATTAAAAEVPREIVVTGEGLVEVAPDMATVTAGVENQGDTAGATLAANAEAMRAILAALEAAGVERRDIQTSQLSLQPVYRPRNNGDDWTPEVLGYVARNTVAVRVREIGEVGSVVDATSEAGANRIDGIAFGIGDMRPHLDEARGDAVRNAREKAELYADTAGVTLGEVLGIRETQPIDRPFPMMARAEMAMDGAVAEGTLEVTAMVEMVFAIAGDGAGDAEDDTRGENGDGAED
jgi:uncharacterized protein